MIVEARTQGAKSSSSFSSEPFSLDDVGGGGGGKTRATMMSERGFVQHILLAKAWAATINSKSMAPLGPA